MRSSFFIVSMLILLSSCTRSGPASVVPAPAEYPTTQSGSPAVRFCVNNGGTVSYEKNPNVPTMELVYCTPVGGAKVDAWQYMGNQTSKTGATTNSGAR